MADDKHDYVNLDGIDFYTLHCFHNIGIRKSLIQKQLAYTISFSHFKEEIGSILNINVECVHQIIR